MSVYISARIWATKFPNATRKLIALSLADQATDEGICWPSVRSICERCGVGDSQVREHILALVTDGILEKTNRTGENGRQTSNLFRILVDHLPPLPAPRHPPTGTPAPLPPGQSAPPPSGQSAPLKRKEEPKEGKGEAGLFDAPEQQRTISTSATMIEIWNKVVPSLSKITRMSGERLKLAIARWKDLGSTAANWQSYCEKVESSDFLTGRVKKGRDWTATFDWCIIPANFDKVREGRYQNQPKTDDTNQPPTSKRFW